MAIPEAVDDYLKAIFEIGDDGGRVSTQELAQRLDVAPASVTGMLRKLSEQQPPLISYEKHRGATLSSKGRLRALEIIRHHRLIECFLHEMLGYPLDEVHDEAERLEHAISETFEERIDRALGFPSFDPHGHPIPRKDGTMPDQRRMCLAEVGVDVPATIVSISDDDPEVLRYLMDIGVRPGVRFRVVERGPFDGPVTLQLKDGARLPAMGARVAAGIYVAPAEAAAS